VKGRRAATQGCANQVALIAIRAEVFQHFESYPNHGRAGDEVVVLEELRIPRGFEMRAVTPAGRHHIVVRINNREARLLFDSICVDLECRHCEPVARLKKAYPGPFLRDQRAQLTDARQLQRTFDRAASDDRG
jgi:hypothetical protein